MTEPKSAASTGQTEPHPLALAEMGGDISPTRFVPQKMKGLMALCNMFAKSGVGIPDALKGKPADILTVALAGAEFGLTPYKALQNFHIIKGKVSPAAAMLRGLVLSKPHICEYLTMAESTSERATFVTKRVGAPEPVSLTFSLDDARQAGLLGKDNWKKNTADMLIARASSRLCRAVYPDICAGIYSSEEMGDLETTAPEATVDAEGSPQAEVLPEASDKLGGLTAALEADTDNELHADDIAPTGTTEAEPAEAATTEVSRGGPPPVFDAYADGPKEQKKAPGSKKEPAISMDEAEEVVPELMSKDHYAALTKAAEEAGQTTALASMVKTCWGRELEAVDDDNFESLMEWIQPTRPPIS